jgi:hypothetical protein
MAHIAQTVSDAHPLFQTIVAGLTAKLLGGKDDSSEYCANTGRSKVLYAPNDYNTYNVHRDF